MISKQYFEKTFSLATAQTLQEWADYNLITASLGDYAMKIEYLSNTSMFAETEVSGLTIGDEYTLFLHMDEIVSNTFKIKINSIANDNSSMVTEVDYGLGVRSITFTATEEIMYIVIGDESAEEGIYSIVDNVSLKINGAEAINNGGFENENTTGWYAQNSNATLVVYEYNVAPPVGDNPYLEIVTIPAYNSGDNSHVLITTSNGNESELNTIGKEHFYVEPGEYGATAWDITASGSSSNRKTISLYNGNDLHPGKLSDAERAYFGVHLNGASYWDIDRLSYKEDAVSIVYFDNESTFNTLNRAFTRDCGNSVYVSHMSNNNTIQNCRFEYMTEWNREIDIMCILLQHNRNGSGADHVDIWDTKIINNEIIDQNDGLHVARNRTENAEYRQSGDVQGLIVDGNRWWREPDTTYTEDAIDVKIGSANPANPVIISNNIMWQYDASSSDGPVIFHANPYNVEYTNNIAFDCSNGFSTGANSYFDNVDEPGVHRGLMDSKVQGNLIYNCGNSSSYCLNATSVRNTIISENAIINGGTKGYADLRFDSSNTEFKLNDLCNVTDSVWTEGSDSTLVDSIDNNSHYNTAIDGGYTEDFVFTKNEFTNNPETITLVNAVKP